MMSRAAPWGSRRWRFDRAAQRSVAAEVESAPGPRLGDAPRLVDDAGSARILGVRQEVRRSRARLARRG